MQWQDPVFTGGSIAFAFAMIPTIKGKEKPALQTSLITGLVLFIFAISYMTLSLWFSAASTTVNAILWLVLAFQKIKQQKLPH